MSQNFQNAIELIKNGNKKEGRKFLVQELKANPQNELAWLWMVKVSRSHKERLLCIDKVLEINPNNQTALKWQQRINDDLDHRKSNNNDFDRKTTTDSQKHIESKNISDIDTVADDSSTSHHQQEITINRSDTPFGQIETKQISVKYIDGEPNTIEINRLMKEHAEAGWMIEPEDIEITPLGILLSFFFSWLIEIGGFFSHTIVIVSRPTTPITNTHDYPYIICPEAQKKRFDVYTIAHMAGHKFAYVQYRTKKIELGVASVRVYSSRHSLLYEVKVMPKEGKVDIEYIYKGAERKLIGIVHTPSSFFDFKSSMFTIYNVQNQPFVNLTDFGLAGADLVLDSGEGGVIISGKVKQQRFFCFKAYRFGQFARLSDDEEGLLFIATLRIIQNLRNWSDLNPYA